MIPFEWNTPHPPPLLSGERGRVRGQFLVFDIYFPRRIQ